MPGPLARTIIQVAQPLETDLRLAQSQRGCLAGILLPAVDGIPGTYLVYPLVRLYP
jgi:hypothetical protein